MNATRKSVLLIPVAFALACSASPSSGGSFVGSWRPTGGQQTTQCSTGTFETPPTAGSLVIEGGPSQIVTEPGNECNLLWNVTGGTAMLAGTQTCAVPGTVATFTSGTLVLEGRSMMAATQGYATVNGSTGCTFGQSFTLERD